MKARKPSSRDAKPEDDDALEETDVFEVPIKPEPEPEPEPAESDG